MGRKKTTALSFLPPSPLGFKLPVRGAMQLPLDRLLNREQAHTTMPGAAPTHSSVDERNPLKPIFISSRTHHGAKAGMIGAVFVKISDANLRL